MFKTSPQTNKGQTINAAIVGVALLASVGTKSVDWMASRLLDSPDVAAKEIQDVKTSQIKLEAKVDKVCTYSTNQGDRMDKNLQSIARALKVDVVTGNDKDNPCLK